MIGGGKILGERFNGLQARQVEWLKFDLGLRNALQNIRTRGFTFFFIPAGKDHLGASLRENAGRLKSDTAIRTGHNRNTPGLIRNIFFAPRHDRSSFGFTVSVEG